MLDKLSFRAKAIAAALAEKNATKPVVEIPIYDKALIIITT